MNTCYEKEAGSCEPRRIPQGLGVRQPSGAVDARKAAEGCRSPRRWREFSREFEV